MLDLSNKALRDFEISTAGLQSLIKVHPSGLLARKNRTHNRRLIDRQKRGKSVGEPGSKISNMVMKPVRDYMRFLKLKERAKYKEQSIIEGRPYGSPKTFRHDLTDLLNVDLGLDPNGKISFKRSLRLARQHINVKTLTLCTETKRLFKESHD